MTSDARLDRLEATNRRRRQQGLEPIRLDGTSSMERVGVLPSTSRIAQTIEHNRGIRQRLIAAIQADAGRLNLSDAALRAQLVRMTGQRHCSDLSLEQLRLVAGVLRKQVPPRSESSRGAAAAGGLGAPAAAPSPSSSPKEDTT